DDPRLRELRIGLHTVGDDYANTPPAQLLAQRGIRDNVRGYSIYGDYSRPAPARALVDAVAEGEIDVAIVWGPIGGYFARQRPEPLAVSLLDDSDEALRMNFRIAMGTRKDDEALRAALDEGLRRHAREVEALLADYGV